MRPLAVLSMIIALAISTVGCGGDSAPPPATPEPTQPKVADQKDAARTTLPDLTADLTRGACDQGPGVHGADSYFAGELVSDGDAVKGTERWILFANEKWKEKGGSDCEITWSITGFRQEPGACGACDFGVQLSAVADVAGSTCVEDLVKREAKNFDVAYDVKLLDNGTVQVYFAKSGKLLGEGYHSGNRLNYLTQHQCKWF